MGSDLITFVKATRQYEKATKAIVPLAEFPQSITDTLAKKKITIRNALDGRSSSLKLAIELCRLDVTSDYELQSPRLALNKASKAKKNKAPPPPKMSLADYTKQNQALLAQGRATIKKMQEEVLAKERAEMIFKQALMGKRIKSKVVKHKTYVPNLHGPGAQEARRKLIEHHRAEYFKHE